MEDRKTDFKNVYNCFEQFPSFTPAVISSPSINPCLPLPHTRNRDKGIPVYGTTSLIILCTVDYSCQFRFGEQNYVFMHQISNFNYLEIEFYKLEIEIHKLEIEFQKLEIEFHKLKIEFQKLEFHNLEMNFHELEIEFQELRM